MGLCPSPSPPSEGCPHDGPVPLPPFEGFLHSSPYSLFPPIEGFPDDGSCPLPIYCLIEGSPSYDGSCPLDFPAPTLHPLREISPTYITYHIDSGICNCLLYVCQIWNVNNQQGMNMGFLLLCVYQQNIFEIAEFSSSSLSTHHLSFDVSSEDK